MFIAVVIRELERKSVQMFSSWLIPSARARSIIWIIYPSNKLQIRIEALYHLFALLQSKMADSKYRKILFVCRGNTCRSPTAKAILRHLIQEREDRNGWGIESAGTDVSREGLPSSKRGLQVLTKTWNCQQPPSKKSKGRWFSSFRCNIGLW